MGEYQVIAKKYRPQKFSEVYEQDAIVATLKNAIRLKRVGHAYLFCGCRGTGKTTLARLFAKAINCKKRSQDEEPCNSCQSCKEITSGHSLDVIEIDGASNRGIDDIRNLNETVGYAASAGDYKIYIIDEVHMLTKEAFNALLKTLEEPPEHVIFFFATTEPHKVLPTIVSRCQRFDLKRITPEKMAAKLTSIAQDLKVEIKPEALHLIASHAEGSLRDAESLLDQIICFQAPPITIESVTKTLGLVSQNLFFELDQAAAAGNAFFAFGLADRIFRQGSHLLYFLENLTEHYRHIALIQLGEEKNLTTYFTESQLAAYRKTARLYTQEQALSILDYLMEMLEGVQKSPFKRINLEILLLHIIRSMKQMPIDHLVKQLLALKEELKNEPSPPPQLAQDTPTPPIPTQATPPAVESPPEEVPFFPPSKPEPASPPKPKQETSAPSLHDETQLKKKIKHDRVLRFAGVELNGNIKKE